MHVALIEQIVKTCRQRLEEGDHPTVPPPTPEAMEDCIIALADRIDAARRELRLGTV